MSDLLLKKGALVARLAAVPAIAAITGANIAWLERPRRGALPAITLTMIYPGREYTHEGADELDMPLLQFDFWGEDADDLRALADLVITEMERQPHVDVAPGGGVVRFHPAFLERDQDETPVDLDSDLKVYRIIQEWRFHWEVL
jgi:hypothetical protein